MMETFAGIMLAMVVLCALVALANQYRDRDDTDPPGGRSNLKVFTDYATGLQYLGSGRGGLTPRLDRDGNHMRSQRAP